MFELVFIFSKIILAALAGVGIAKIIVDESVFEGWVASLKSKLFYPIDPYDTTIIQDVNTGGVIKHTEDGEWEVLSPDGYRTDKPRIIALMMGKLGDLLECSGCLGKEIALWLTVFSVVFTFLPIEVLAVGSVLGITYLIERLLR